MRQRPTIQRAGAEDRDFEEGERSAGAYRRQADGDWVSAAGHFQRRVASALQPCHDSIRGWQLQRSARGTMTMPSKKHSVLTFAVLAALTIAFQSPSWAQTAECVPGETVTVTGTISRMAQRPDGKEWAFTLQDRNSAPCRADAVILADPTKPGACNPGRRITGTGKVHLFNKNNPQSQIVYSKDVTCQ